jgi:hypothetical protein
MGILRIVIGAAVLLVGRPLYWLFVGAAGFVAAMTLTVRLFTGSPDWLVVLIGLAAGLLGILLAVFFQRVTVALAGFLAGGYVALTLVESLNLNLAILDWVVYVIAGILGLILASALFDWALILLSSLVGAALIVSTLAVGPPIKVLAFAGLAIIGLGVQAAQYRSRSASEGSAS